jgi:hypothetical protein
VCAGNNRKYVLSLGSVRSLVYKEERDQKNIDLHIELKDASDQVVAAHDPIGELDLCLLYENLEQVKEQNILRLVSGSGLHLVSGRATVRFQITDVSKNHQKQKFRIRVAAEPYQCIGHATTEPILVKSKRSRPHARRPASPASLRERSDSGDSAEHGSNIHESKHQEVAVCVS